MRIELVTRNHHAKLPLWRNALLLNALVFSAFDQNSFYQITFQWFEVVEEEIYGYVEGRKTLYLNHLM